MRITNRIVYVLIVLLIFCFLSWQDYDLLFQTKAATGIDGYYYVLQIDSLLERRGLYFPTSAPLVLYMLGGMAFIIGNQILAVKVGALLLHLLLCTGLGCFLYALTKNLKLSVLGVLLTALSALHVYFLTEFISQLGALAFMVWGSYGTVKSFQYSRLFYSLIFITVVLVPVTLGQLTKIKNTVSKSVPIEVEFKERD